MPTLHTSGPTPHRRHIAVLSLHALAGQVAAVLAISIALAVGTGTARAAGAMTPTPPTPPAASASSAGATLPLTPTGLVRMPDGRLLAPEFARILNRGELVVAMLGVDQPPFFETRNGRLQGVDVDIANELAAKLGVKVRFNRDAKTFDGVVSLLANGDADVAISKLSRTLARAEIISFSTPYVRLHRALLLNRINFAQVAHDRAAPEVIRSYDSTIGVVMNSSYSQYVGTNFPNAKVKPYPSWDALLGALDKGEVTAAYRDEFEVKHVLKSDPTASLKLRVVTLDDLDDPIAIGVNVSMPAMLAFVNQFLAERSKKLDVKTLLQATDK